MVLGIEELHKLVKEQKLVDGLSERELTSPEGAGFDLRIGELYEVSGEGYLGIEQRDTPKMKLIASYKEGEKKEVVLKPHIYYAMKTVEDVNLPNNILAMMTARSTLFRSGISLFGGQVPPGYEGGLVLGVYNFRDTDFHLEMGARVVHIMFFEVKGTGNMYRGQWRGGRVTTDGRETQV